MAEHQWSWNNLWGRGRVLDRSWRGARSVIDTWRCSLWRWWRIQREPSALSADPPSLPRSGLLPDEGYSREAFEAAGGDLKALLSRADDVCAHVFELFGSGPLCLDPLDWHADIPIALSGFPSGLHDVKTSWELSRCYHLVWLGQAYHVSGDERYACEAIAQINSWIEQNPFCRGTNWVSAMDVAIRAVNWLWTWHLIAHSPAVNLVFERRLSGSLYQHGDFIAHNLENRGYVTNNHYLCDVAGLAYLGCLLPESPRVRRWRRRGLKGLEREMRRQVNADGTSFEGSTSYHRLACEVFLSCTILARRCGHAFSALYMQRLERMVEAIVYLTGPDGLTPLVGDCDNGRLHRASVWPRERALEEWSDYRHLLSIGSIVFDRTDLAAATGASPQARQEAYWLLGNKAILPQETELSAREQSDSAALHDAGWYALIKKRAQAIIVAGKPGQRGFAGHNHNDSLSVIYQDAGVHWFEDPGTGVYTANPALRNQLRLAQSHSVLMVDGIEPNGLPPNNLFRLDVRTVPWLVSWTGESVTLGRRLPTPTHIEHQRSVWFEDKALCIRDQLIGNGKHRVSVRFCLGAGVVAESSHSRVMLSGGGLERRLTADIGLLQPRVVGQVISRGYGHIVTGSMVIYEGYVLLPFDITWRLVDINHLGN